MISNISPKKELFCQAFVSGKTAAESYRCAFDTSKMKQGTIWNKASEMLNNHEVRDRIEFLRKQMEEKCLWSIKDSVDALKRVIDDPDKTSDIVGAVKELNNMFGYKATQKIDLTTNGEEIITSITIVNAEVDADIGEE